MNKQEYLHELEKALRAANVKDSADILEEYAEHFYMKAADGYGEEEIAAKLAPPAEIAGQFGEIKSISVKSGIKIVSATGLFFADIFAGSFFIIFCAWVFALAILALSSVIAGVFATLGMSALNPGGTVVLLPGMPYICALLLGIALLALAVLAAVATEYCRLYASQLLRVYARWHKAVWGRNNMSPPPPLHPVIKTKKRRIMRKAALIAVAVFAVAFVAGLGSMMLAAGSLEPWHVWHWFE